MKYVGKRYYIGNDETKNHKIQEMLFQKGYKWCTDRTTHMSIDRMTEGSGHQRIKPWWVYANEEFKHIFWREENDPITNVKNNLYGEYETAPYDIVPKELFKI